jgi:hypothetical protein
VSPEDERERAAGLPISRSLDSTMTIDGINIHPSITADRIMTAVNDGRTRLDDPGFCVRCGADALGVEPDTRQYECEVCGEPAVYGAEELLLCL